MSTELLETHPSYGAHETGVLDAAAVRVTDSSALEMLYVKVQEMRRHIRHQYKARPDDPFDEVMSRALHAHPDENVQQYMRIMLCAQAVLVHNNKEPHKPVMREEVVTYVNQQRGADLVQDYHMFIDAPTFYDPDTGVAEINLESMRITANGPSVSYVMENYYFAEAYEWIRMIAEGRTVNNELAMQRRLADLSIANSDVA